MPQTSIKSLLDEEGHFANNAQDFLLLHADKKDTSLQLLPALLKSYADEILAHLITLEGKEYAKDLDPKIFNNEKKITNLYEALQDKLKSTQENIASTKKA